jgi:hypothetical protein
MFVTRMYPAIENAVPAIIREMIPVMVNSEANGRRPVGLSAAISRSSNVKRYAAALTGLPSRKRWRSAANDAAS